MTDEKGVLGKLPRSRPGHRSDKRAATAGRPSQAATRAAEQAEAEGGAAAAPPKPTAGPKKRTSTARPAASRPAARPDPQAPAPGRQGADPVGTAARAVGAGVRLGAGLAQEVLKRIPRP